MFSRMVIPALYCVCQQPTSLTEIKNVEEGTYRFLRVYGNLEVI